MVRAARVPPQQAEDGWETGFLNPFSVGIQHWNVLTMQFRALLASFFKQREPAQPDGNPLSSVSTSPARQTSQGLCGDSESPVDELSHEGQSADSSTPAQTVGPSRKTCRVQQSPPAALPLDFSVTA